MSVVKGGVLRMLHAPGSNFIPGKGERRPCSRLSACFDAWAKYTARHKVTSDGHCSATCCSFEPEARS